MSSYRWIPWAFAAALGVVVVVNGTLAYFAATSATGLVTAHPFDTGNSYNRVLAAAATQDALGWRAAIGIANREIVAELAERDGKPLEHLQVTARLVRPVEPIPDVIVRPREEAPGRYAAPAWPARTGQWDVHLSARRGADLFEFTQRIIIK